MLIDTNKYCPDLTELASNDMNKWNAQEEMLEKHRNSLILALKNLVHFEISPNGGFISVDEYEKPRYILTEKQLETLYKSEDNLIILIKETTEELLNISSNMQNSIDGKNKKNRNNQDLLASILRKREV